MQLDTYWSEIKNQSKAITGVEKVKLGLFSGNASGVGTALSAVTKAKKPADAVKAAGKAKTTIANYLVKVHKVEAKRPNLTAPQKQSMSIIEKALGKITKELDALVASGGANGPGKDRNAAEDAAWFKIKDEAMAHLQLREQGAVDAAAVLKSAQDAVAALKSAAAGVAKAVQQAQATRQKGDMAGNLGAFDLLQRYVEEAEALEKKIHAEANAKLHSGDSPLMKTRSDYKLPDTIAKAKADDYRMKSNTAFRKGDDAAQKAQELIRGIDKAVIQIKTAAERAETYSMQGKDPGAYTKRIDEMNRVLGQVKSLLAKMDTVEGLAEKIKQWDYSKLAPPAKTKVLDDRQKIVDTFRARLEQADTQCTAIEERAKAIPGEIAEYPQIKSGLTAIAKEIAGYRKNFGGWRKDLDDAEKVIAELR